MKSKNAMIELLNSDCMEYMKGLEDNAFDICITSPPYNMNLRVNAKGDGYCSRAITKGISSKYKNYSDNLPMDEYYDFLNSFIKEAARVSNLVFLNIQQITGNKPAIYRSIGENASILKETIIWDKIATSPAINYGTLSSAFEFIFVFGGNPITRQFLDSPNFERGTESNIWRIPTEKRAHADHGAGFPLALVNKILHVFGTTGQKIIDPFMGIGTSAISAHYGGFDFVGCEIDKDYYDAAVKRFNLETAQVDMFGGCDP